MARYAALIPTLSISGSRLTDGTPNASGTCWFFQPGTNTQVTVYANAEATTVVTQPITLGEGGKLPSNLSNGVFATQPVRILIQDVSGQTVTDNVYIPATAGNVGVSNAGFSDSTLDAVLTDALTSFGGQDWKYKESGGATARTVKAKFAEAWISVKDFGAAGDGVATDTVPIQLAFNRAKSLACNVVFPAGTYKIDQAITLTSATGVQIEGRGGATLTSTSGTANGLTLSSCSYCGVRNLTVSSGGSTGSGIAATSNDHLIIDGVAVEFFQTGLSLTGSLINVRNSYIDAFGGGAAQRGITSSATDVAIIGGRVTAAAGAAIEFHLTAARTAVYGVSTGPSGSTATGILFNANLSGSIFTVAGCTGLGACTAPIDVTGVAVWPGLRQFGNGVRGPAPLSFATGTSQTPVVMVGDEIVLSADSGGAGAVTVNLPAVVPSGVDANNRYYDFVFVNNAGGAVTWNLNAAYVLSGAVAVPTTAGHTIQLRFRYDASTSKFRECSRGDTVT